MQIKGTEWRQRLSALGVTNVIPTPGDEAKKSAVILELADPLLDEDSTDAEHVESIVLLTILTWNKAMFSADSQDGIEKEILDALVPPDGDAELLAEIIQAMDLIEERRKRLFPDLYRIVYNYDLQVSEGKIALNVASAPLAAGR